MPWKKQISSGKWLLNNNAEDDESLHNLISPKNNHISSSNNDVNVLSNSMQMMSLSSPGMVTNIIHGVKPSTIADNDNSLELDAETVTEESKGCVEKNTTNNKEMRLIHRVSLSISSSSSSISSSSNESTTAIIYETLDDIICRIENKDLDTSYKVAYRIQQQSTEKQQLDEDEIKEEEDSYNSGELTKSCDSADGSIEQECSSSQMISSSPSGNIQTSALNKFLSSPSPTNWESLVSSMKHRSQSPWGDGEFAVINVKGNDNEGSVVSDFDDSIEENKYAFINKYLTQKTDASNASGGLESSAVEREVVEPSSTVARGEDPQLETAAADPMNNDTQVGVEAAVNNDTAEVESAPNNNEEAVDESSPNTIEDDAVLHMEVSVVDESSPPIEEGSYKRLSKKDTIYQSISMCKTKMKSLARQCRGRKKESYSKIPTSDIQAGGFSSTASIHKLQVPSSVTIIDECAYSNCPNLSEVVLSEGVEDD